MALVNSYAPALAITRQLRFREKFILISILFLIPLLYSAGRVYEEIGHAVQIVDMERASAPYLSPLRALLKTVPQHRGLTNGFLNGSIELREKILGLRPQVLEALERLQKLDSDNGNLISTKEPTSNLITRWEKLQKDALEMPPSDAFREHSNLIAEIIGYIEHVGDKGRLSFDHTPEGHYIVDTLIQDLPWLIELIGQTRGLSTGIAARGSINADEVIKLKISMDRIRLANQSLAKNLAAIFQELPRMREKYDITSADSLSKTDSFLNLIEKKLLSGEAISIKGVEVFENGTGAIDAALKLFEDMENALITALSERKSEYREEITVYFSAVALSLAAVFYLYGAIYLSIRNSVQRISEISTRVESGDLSARLELDTKDEMGRIAASINHIVENYNTLLLGLSDSALTLSAAAEELARVTEEVKKSVDDQLMETDLVASAITQMSATVREVAQAAESASAAAQMADEASNEGKKVVSTTINEIDDVAKEVDKIVDVMNALDTQSNAIGTVIEVIKDIADKTNLLALNAAIEAARAGEQGRGFAVVADEVRMLANRTQESTSEIQNIIEKLQVDSKEATGLMKGGQEKVRESVTQAQLAGESLARITQSVDKITEQNHQIASATEEQSTVADEVSRNVVKINTSTNQMAEAMKNVHESSAELARLATNLRLVVEKYTLNRNFNS